MQQARQWPQQVYRSGCKRTRVVLVWSSIVLVFSGAGCTPTSTPDQVASASPVSTMVSLTPVDKTPPADHLRKIDSNLLRGIQSARGDAPAASPVLSTVTINPDGTVDIAIRAEVNEDLVSQIEALGVTVTYVDAPTQTIQARAPLDMIEPIARFREVRFIVPQPRPFTNMPDAPVSPGASPSPMP